MDLFLVEKVLLSLFLAVVAAIAISKLRGKRFKLPPGPIPVPVFGNWLQVGDDLNHRNLTDLAKKFGDIFLLRMGQRNLVVVSSPELAKEVLQTQGVEFGSRTRNVVFDIFTGQGQDMVFTLYGEHWRKMRRIMTVPFFTNKVVQQQRVAWEEEVSRVVEEVKNTPEASTTGIVIRKRLELMMYNNMYRIMFNRRFESLDDPLFVKLRALNGERSRLAQSFEYNYGDFIPILRPFLRGYLKICEDVKNRRLQLFKDYFIDERLKKLGSTKSEGFKCAMDHILEAEKKGEISENNVLYIVENINVAGMDINCGTYLSQYTQLALGQGKIQEEDINRAVSNLFSVQLLLGLFNGDPAKGNYGNLGREDVCTLEHRNLALDAARQGIVLLKNENNLLPLNRMAVTSLAIIGPSANSSSQLGGDYTGVPCNPTSIFEGLQHYIKTNYASGCGDTRCDSSKGFAEAVRISREADAVVVVAGLDLSQEDEGRDRASLLLPGRQMDLISAVSTASEKPIILILLGGGPIDISFAKVNPRIGSILWIGYPGEAGGQAVADTIFGEFNPGGRLSITWYPESFISVPMNDMSLRPDPSRGYPGRTYRFYTGEVVYEFGYGLSYSNYSYKFILVPDKVVLSTDTNKASPSKRLTSQTLDGIEYMPVDEITSCNHVKFEVPIAVFNHGDMDGSHVIILFGRASAPIRGAPHKTLIGFTRVHTKSSSAVQVSMGIDPCKHFSIVNEHGLKILPLGTYLLMLEGLEHSISIEL